MKEPPPIHADHGFKSTPSQDEEVPGYHWSLPEVRIVVFYIVIASIWIVGSDLYLTKTVVSEIEAGIIQSLKGLNFVLTTGILLFFVLRRSYGGWRRAEERRLTVVRKARERYRGLCSRVQSLREEERTRIAREVHDELGQLLTGIKLELRMMENQLTDRADRSLNPVIDRLVETGEIVDSTITSVQRISAGLRPSALDHLGLSAALTEEAELFTLRTEIPCIVEIHDPLVPMTPDVDTAVFRIFQESLTNVARHAHASNASASLSTADGFLKLRILDDGDGISSAVVDDPKSLGLIGMLERAEYIGGCLTIRGLPEKGTEVTLIVPLPKQTILP
ncbi:MAG: sensor histidine kinase [Luteolibacter sp.]